MIPHRVVQKNAPFLAILLLVIFAIFAITSAWTKAPTFDEPNWMNIAWYLTHTWSWQADYHVLMHPPLSFYLHGIPLRLWEWWRQGSQSSPPEGALVEQFPYPYANFFRYHTVFMIAKLSMLPLAIILGWYIYLWAAHLYGRCGGLLALSLYVFNPYSLAYATIITTDLPATAFMFIATYHFWRFCRYPVVNRLVWAGVILGLAFLSKASALLLLPLFGLLSMGVIIRSYLGRASSFPHRSANIKRFLLGIGVLVIIALFVLEAGYLFDIQPIRAFHPQQAEDRIYRWLHDIPIPFGAHINSMRLHQSFILSMTRKQFLHGEVSTTTWWYYHLLTFLFKNPIPLLVFFALSLYSLIQRTPSPRALLSREIFLILPAGVVFWYFSVLFPLNVSSRFVLPAYPFLFVLSSRFSMVKCYHRASVRIVCGAFLVWYLLSAAAAFPNYLAYCNELIGGTERGVAWFADSSYDWGQDLKGLGAYMQDRQIPTIKLAYFGKAIPEYYGIRYTPFLEPEGCVPTTGLIAISATRWQGVYEQNQACYAWLKRYEPIDKIGDTIFIYAIP